MKIWWLFSLSHGVPENDLKLFFQKKRPHADKWVCAQHRFPTIKEKKFNLLLFPCTFHWVELLLLMDKNINYISFFFSPSELAPDVRRVKRSTIVRILHFLNLLRSDTRICRRLYPTITYVQNDFLGFSNCSDRW